MGDLEAGIVDVTRPTLESKEFEIKDKEKAYEYMNDLFEKGFL